MSAVCLLHIYISLCSSSSHADITAINAREQRSYIAYIKYPNTCVPYVVYVYGGRIGGVGVKQDVK